ncbi:beta-ketoacyl synthase N-terminal-like domain-containing protein [Blastomonas sp.]|uniref:thiolase family protein n=1 Tax=Blastomonas sp. TaxID=1909299 RepID=UPI002637939A|nr:beta-ketoacyl synthase N-terminal-like domain-containing protein [Blastomonas sp.]MDM7955110.1 acyl-CoA thiolase [Blastomonas sp.]
MNVFIQDALRTPRGKARPDGGLAAHTPHGLIAALVDALKARGAQTDDAEALILGCVGQVGAQGGNIAEVAKLAAGLPDAVAAQTINSYCASGLMAIGQAAALIEAGVAKNALAGGVEMMSQVPFMADRASYYTDTAFEPPARYIPVALAADRLAGREAIDRAALDAAAFRSQTASAAAEDSPALIRSRIAVGELSQDECIRAGMTEAKLAAMPPAFAEMHAGYREAMGGETVEPRLTVAHAPPMCDGAGLALVSADSAGARARVVAYAQAGGSVEDSLLAGFTAMDRALADAGLSLSDIDVVEFMEAFAVVIAKFLRDRDVDPARVNIGGGHLAKGHPMGATGAILLSSLLDALDARDGRFGMVVVTGASGIGAAMIVERLAA